MDEFGSNGLIVSEKSFADAARKGERGARARDLSVRNCFSKTYGANGVKEGRERTRCRKFRQVDIC